MIKTKTIAKGKCFESPARQRDSLVFLINLEIVKLNQCGQEMYGTVPSFLNCLLILIKVNKYKIRFNIKM